MESTDGRKVSRRKRKLHHGPSSLLRATIQEYGLYDKEVDAFRSKFIQLFQFLAPWSQRASFRAENGQTLLPDGSKTVQEGPTDTSRARSVLSRDLCLEEELELRLERMTSIARTLRVLCARERELKQVLYRESFDCRNQCLVLLNDMIGHFHKEAGVLQSRLLEMDGALEEAEQEKMSLRQSCQDTVSQASEAMQAAQAELDKALQKIASLNQEISTTRDQKLSCDRENEALRMDIRVLNTKVTDLEKQAKELQGKIIASDMAREHFETLLDIAVNKLRLYEESGMKPKLRKSRDRDCDSVRDSVSRSLDTSGTPSVVLPGDCSSIDGRISSDNPLYRRRAVSDTHSITSLETLSSDYSMPLMESRRFGSEDRLSVGSGHHCRTLPSRSPVVAPRRRNKKKQFFSKPFLRKSTSSDSHISSSMDRLPTIADELDDKLRLDFVKSESNLRRYSTQISASDFEAIESEIRDNHVAGTPRENFEKRATLISFEEPKKIHRSNSHAVVTPLSLDEKAKAAKKVKRTSSFGGLKTKKTGLVALANNIEKKFRRKRRSKTMDNTEIRRTHNEFLASVNKSPDLAGNDEFY